jgi:hypothetical protein
VDFGFYAFNKNMEGGYPEFMDMMVEKLATDPKTKYYLLFGRQTDSNGPNTKLWVKVKLPNNQYFNCIWQERLNTLDEYMKMTTQVSYRKGVYKTEIECMTTLKNLVLKFIDCCSEGRSDECTPDGVIITFENNLGDRLLHLLNDYVGNFDPVIFGIKKVGNINRLTARTLKPSEIFSDDKKKRFYEKIKFFTSPVDINKFKIPDASIYLVDENTSVFLEDGKKVDGKTVFFDEYDTGVIDVGDLEVAAWDAPRAFFHVLSEQYLKKLDRTNGEWLKYITSKNGQVETSLDTKDPTYPICHAYTVQEEATVFEYCFPFFKEEHVDNGFVKRRGTDKANFEIVKDDRYINKETFNINTVGAKVLFSLEIKFKDSENLTIISYDKK